MPAKGEKKNQQRKRGREVPEGIEKKRGAAVKEGKPAVVLDFHNEKVVK